jgi:hypothetical protein
VQQHSGQRLCQDTIIFHKLPIIASEAKEPSQFSKTYWSRPFEHISCLLMIYGNHLIRDNMTEIVNLVLGKGTLFEFDE